jgi:cytochrome c553
MPRPQGKSRAVCAACQARTAQALDPTQPILAGQITTIWCELTDYKIGRRNNPIMKGFAGQLSKQDIETWRRGFEPEVQPARPALNS